MRSKDSDEPRAPSGRLADVARAGELGVADGSIFDAVTPSYVALDVEIPSDVSEIEPIVSLVTEHCKALRLTRRQCSLNIPVALSEALSNAIIRGNHEDPRKHVRLRATVSDAALVFDVADEGRGFDMATASRDPTSPEHVTREEGRGVFLMHQLMDRVEQFRDPRHVVRLTLNR
ncbi:MAG: ATP-binding protein [Gemmatimonadota bacterium]|nr:ATP-binding protein [Gemmatimonadota bacterium]